MSVSQVRTFKYVGSSAIKMGTLLKLTTNPLECDVATGVTDIPCGVALTDVAAGNTTAQNVGVGCIEGEVYKVVASTTISIGDKLGPTTGGKSVAITLSTTYAQEWIWGVALTAGGSGGTDIVSMRYGPQIAS